MISPMTKLKEIIAPSFYAVHRDIAAGKHTHYWLKGGRGSTKSSFVSVEIPLGIMRNPDANAVVIRKVGLYLKDSVYEQLMWAIERLGVSHLWQAKLSPLELVYLPTGQRIIFRGADKPKKLKSTKVRKGYIRYVWYEEADEFAGEEEIRTINQSLLRGGREFTVFYTYNPPKSQRNWINSAVAEPAEDKLVHHSDYRTVPAEWLGEQFLAEAEHLRTAKPEAYAHEYLGEVTGTGGEVFANITVREISLEERRQFSHIRRGLDWGYAADPTAYVVCALERRRLFIFGEIYRYGVKFDPLAEAIKAENPQNSAVSAESADPRSNDEMRDRGLKIYPVKKGAGSVEHGITWLQNLDEIIIDPVSCPNAKREFCGYEYVPDGNGGFRDGFPDKDNHTIDAVRYALEADIGRKTAVIRNRKEMGIY